VSEEANGKWVVSYRWSIVTNLLSRTVYIMTCYRQNVVFTYLTVVHPQIWQNYPSNFRTTLGSLSRGRITLLIREILSDYLNVCDHNPPTLQTNGRTTYDSNTTLRAYVLRALKMCLLPDCIPNVVTNARKITISVWQLMVKLIILLNVLLNYFIDFSAEFWTTSWLLCELVKVRYSAATTQCRYTRRFDTKLIGTTATCLQRCVLRKLRDSLTSATTSSSQKHVHCLRHCFTIFPADSIIIIIGASLSWGASFAFRFNLLL